MWGHDMDWNILDSHHSPTWTLPLWKTYDICFNSRKLSGYKSQGKKSLNRPPLKYWLLKQKKLQLQHAFFMILEGIFHSPASKGWFSIDKFSSWKALYKISRQDTKWPLFPWGFGGSTHHFSLIPHHFLLSSSWCAISSMSPMQTEVTKMLRTTEVTYEFST